MTRGNPCGNTFEKRWLNSFRAPQQIAVLRNGQPTRRQLGIEADQLRIRLVTGIRQFVFEVEIADEQPLHLLPAAQPARFPGPNTVRCSRFGRQIRYRRTESRRQHGGRGDRSEMILSPESILPDGMQNRKPSFSESRASRSAGRFLQSRKTRLNDPAADAARRACLIIGCSAERPLETWRFVADQGTGPGVTDSCESGVGSTLA